jgi:hypothetical protein
MTRVLKARYAAFNTLVSGVDFKAGGRIDEREEQGGVVAAIPRARPEEI